MNNKVVILAVSLVVITISTAYVGYGMGVDGANINNQKSSKDTANSILGVNITENQVVVVDNVAESLTDISVLINDKVSWKNNNTDAITISIIPVSNYFEKTKILNIDPGESASLLFPDIGIYSYTITKFNPESQEIEPDNSRMINVIQR